MRWLTAVVVFAGVTVLACVSEPLDATCPDYCALVTGECKGTDAQYVTASGSTDDTMTACKLICSHFLASPDAGPSSIACRKSAVSSASETKDPATHRARCMGAGPFSDVCGGTVANYCRLELALCAGNPFADETACSAGFTMVTKNGFDAMGINDPGIPNENSKLCRFYHLEKATEDSALHCPHTNAPVSPVCVK